MSESRKKIVDEILMERMEAQERWTMSHDDQHTRSRSWGQLISAYCNGATNRHVLVQIAGLCIAAIESMDRLNHD